MVSKKLLESVKLHLTLRSNFNSFIGNSVVFWMTGILLVILRACISQINLNHHFQ